MGVRGEGTEVSVVHDSQTLQAASMRYELDEGHLDDWLALQLLLEDPTLPETLGIAPSESRKLADAMAKIVSSLKQAGAIVFHSTHFAAASTALPPPSDDAGSFDVAKQLASKKDVKGKGKKKTEAELESELIEVAHPLDSEAEPLQIGLARHKYLEPFFLPTLLADLAPSASPTAAMLNFTQYEGKETVCAGIQEVIGDMLVSIDVIDTKRAVWGALVVVSSGNVGGIKGEHYRSISHRTKLTRTLDSVGKSSCPTPGCVYRRLGPAGRALTHTVCADAGILFRVQSEGRRARVLSGSVYSRQGEL